MFLISLCSFSAHLRKLFSFQSSELPTLGFTFHRVKYGDDTAALTLELTTTALLSVQDLVFKLILSYQTEFIVHQVTPVLADYSYSISRNPAEL